MCVKPEHSFDQLLDIVLKTPLPAEHYQFIRRCCRDDLQRRFPDLKIDRHLPVKLLFEAPPDVARTYIEKDHAKVAIEKKIRGMCATPAVKRGDCGQGGSVYMQKVEGDGCKNRLCRFFCGRSDCPFCWRGRQIRTIRRASKRVLETTNDRTRAGKLWCLVIPTAKWKSLNRSLRRRYGDQVGRLHLDRTDGMSVVISDLDPHYTGAVEISPAQAVANVLDSIELLSSRKGSFMLLGEWSDAKLDNGWEIVDGVEECFDYNLVKQALHDMRKNPCFVRGVAGARFILEWRTKTVEESREVWTEVKRRCHFLTNKPSWPKSDSAPKDSADVVDPDDFAPPNNHDPDDEGYF
jgi:hypothetical protein